MKMLSRKQFMLLLVSFITHTGSTEGNVIKRQLEGYSPNSRIIFSSEEANHIGNSEPFSAEETKDQSERGKIDFSFKDISKRVNPLYAEKNGGVSYEIPFPGSNTVSLLSKKRSAEYSKPSTIIHKEEDLGVTFRSISHGLISEGGNMAPEGFRNGDIERQKDKLALDAATFSLIQTYETTPSSPKSHTELTLVGVENEKGSRGSRMKNHKTHNHPDTPWTRTKGFPLRLLHSIGTRLTREKNFKQVSNPLLVPVSPSLSYQRYGSFPSSTFPQGVPTAPGKDGEDIEYWDKGNLQSSYGFPHAGPMNIGGNIPVDKEKEIRRMKRNAAGDQFTKHPNPHRTSTSDSPEKAGKVHSNESSQQEEPVHSPTPAEALERLKLLVGEIVQELSQFKQKFTLRLIRMTQRDDLTQLPEIMKDFQISPERPIFFIAGGLKAFPVVPTTEASTTTTAFTTTSTLGTTSSEYLRDTILHNESIIATTHATPSDFLPSTTLTPEVEATTAKASNSFMSFPQVLSAWFGVKSPESSATTSEKGFTEPNASTTTSTSPLPINSTETFVEIDSTTNFTPVDPLPTESIMSISTDYSPTESFVDSGLMKDSQDQIRTILSRKRRSSLDMDEMTFYLSPPIPERTARTENPFEDNEPGVYYPVPPSFYELTSWPYEHIIRQSQPVRDDDSDLTDVAEGLLLLPNHSSPPPSNTQGSVGNSETPSLSDSPSGEPQRESRVYNDQRDLGINLHNINLTLPSPEDLALSGVHSESRLNSHLSSQSAIDENDNENIAPLLTEEYSRALSHNNDGDVWTATQSKQAQQTRTAPTTYSKVVRSGSTRGSSENLTSTNSIYNASSFESIENTVPFLAADVNSSSEKIISSLTPPTSSDGNPDPEHVFSTSIHRMNVISLPNEVPEPASISKNIYEASSRNPSVPILSPEFILQHNLDSTLKQKTSPTETPKITEESRSDFKDDRKEITIGIKSIYESDTKVVKPISLPSTSVPKRVTKSIILTPTESAGLLKEKNSTDNIISSVNRSSVNEPEKVEEKVSSKSPIAPEPELEKPHITIITSGTAIDLIEMNNISTPGSSVYSKVDVSSGAVSILKDDETFNPVSGNITHKSKIEVSTEKPLEINVKISSPIIDAATSIIQSIFGFGKTHVPNEREAASNTHNHSKADTKETLDRKKEANNSLLSENAVQFSLSNITSTSDAQDATPTTGESQSFLESNITEALSNLSSSDAILPHDTNGTSRLTTQPITTKLDDTHKSHSSNDLPQVTLTNNLTSAELFNVQNKATSTLVGNTSENGEPLVAVAANFDKENLSQVSYQYFENPIPQPGESIGSKYQEDSNSDHVFTKDQNGNQTHVENLSASTYSVPQPDHDGLHKVVHEFNPTMPSLSRPALNLDSLGTVPTTSGIVSVSSPILPQESHVHSPLSNNPFLEDEILFPTPSESLFPMYQSNHHHAPHSNVPTYFPWIPMPILSHFPQMPPRPFLDYTGATVTSNAPVVDTKQLPTRFQLVSSFSHDTDAPHENQSHKRQEYLMHLYFPNI